MYNGIMKNLILKAMKELSLKEVILIISGKTTFDSGALPEVVVIGHKKTFWERLIEYIQSIPGYDPMVEYQSRTYDVYM